MSETYESIMLNGPERNVEYLGIFVAWLVSNNLLAVEIEHSVASSTARVRMQDLTGPAFLTTVLHGELKPGHLSETGRKFSEYYFVSGKYRTDYDSCTVKGENDWFDYDEVSPKISAAFREFSAPKPKLVKMVAKILKFPGTSR
jgi:hypothetical protein